MVTATPHEDVEAAYGQPPDMVASIIESVRDYGRACADELPDSQQMWLDDIRERLEGLQHEAYADGRKDEREALSNPTEAMIEAGKDERMECLKLPQSPPISVGDALTRIYKAMLGAA